MHQSDKLDPDPNPLQSNKLDSDPADDKPKCMEYEPIKHFFKVLRLFLEARIRILIRIKVKQELDPDPQHWYAIRVYNIGGMQ